MGAYAIARQTSMFAIDHVEVVGVSAPIRKEVRRAAAPLVGTSLLALDGTSLRAQLEALPDVVAIRYDRAFPHTLRVTVVPERAVAVVRSGKESWLVSARGRAMARVPRGGEGRLARVWVPSATAITAGGVLADADGGTAVRALAAAERFPARIATASLAHGHLLFRLRSGLELRLGEPTDLRLKLAVARRALRVVPSGSTYLDVSLPGRPVAGTNPQLSTGG
jgi:cell division protein FtsQ